MSGANAPSVVLDANVLVPETLRDFLLRTAEEQFYDVRWSGHILDEVRRTLVTKEFTSDAGVTRMFAEMHRFFPNAAITGYEPFIDQMTNDAKDRHVLAAAWHARADAIVTFNLRHFPAASLAPYGLRAVSPDAFLHERYDTAPDEMVAVLRRMERERVRPQRIAPEILDALARLAPRFAAAMRGRLADERA